ncbi:hypothetical protein TYRP_020119 [Tyrophagus putrescentiae]|nr:hypothetical protein TYRP_020119 [Tyrophagus putrescentiae]
MNQPGKPQMLKAGVIWLIGTDGLGHNELASCVPSRRTMPINQMTPYKGESVASRHALSSFSKSLSIDWCHLVDRHRRLGAQRACELCPKPSVPINQMTPAFNI